jgi:peptidoglycan/xylan/chitin deacetylase (PgdA/CDA1 family)
MQLLTIVRYHFVRELEKSRYPEIKGLDTRLFREQIEFLARHYNVITMEELIAALYEGRSLPRFPMLLTFDDGYIDHFVNAFPILNEKGFQGSFFVPGQAVMEHRVLLANKIHFILATAGGIDGLTEKIFKLLDKYRPEYGLKENQYYYKKLAVDCVYDPKEIRFVKNLLQVELVEELRLRIADTLFEEFVKIDEESFSRELYMNVDQIRCMKRNGMHIGCHGYSHAKIGLLSTEEQAKEVASCLGFLAKIGVPENGWTICYPHGSYDQSLIRMLKKAGCKIGFAAKFKLAELHSEDPYALPRLDTNDFPKNRSAEPNEWHDEVRRSQGVA